jgi:hypothetical protein
MSRSTIGKPISPNPIQPNVAMTPSFARKRTNDFVVSPVDCFTSVAAVQRQPLIDFSILPS